MALNPVVQNDEPEEPVRRECCAEESNPALKHAFAHFFSSQKPLFSLSRKVWNPPTDIREGKNSIFIRMEVAGINEENLTILMENNVLTVSGMRLEESQAAAATGQIVLASTFSSGLNKHGLHSGQVLLTYGDTEERRRYLNARATVETLLDFGAVPIINENDTVATGEIRYGDNDRLAARGAANSSV